MIKTIQLIKKSLGIYKSKLTFFVAIMAMPALLILLGTFIPLVGKEPTSAFFIANILFLIAIFLLLFTISSIIIALKDNLGVKEAYKKTVKILPHFSIVFLLVSCLSLIWIITPIFISFFIYLLLPFARLLETDPIELFFNIETSIALLTAIFLWFVIGIALFVKFFLSFYLVIIEKLKGFSALSESKRLIKGNYWKVLWRLFVLAFLLIIITGFLNSILILAGVGWTIILLINFSFFWIVMPLCLIYGFLIYKNIQEIKEVKEAGVEVIKTSTLGNKMRKIGATGSYFVIGLLGFVAIIHNVPIFANIIYRSNDEPIYDEADLWLSERIIAIEDNAFYLLAPYKIRTPQLFLDYWPEDEKKALKNIEFKEIYWPREHEEALDDMIVNEEKWDIDLVRQVLGNNRELLIDFQKMSKFDYFQTPTHRNPKDISHDTPSPQFVGLLDIARINALYSAYLFRQGREEEAFDRAIMIIKVGQLIQNDQSTMTSYLVGRAKKEIGLQQIRTMIPKTTLSSEILEGYINQLKQFDLNEKGFKNALKMEYILIRNTKQKKLGEIPSTFFFKPNQTNRKFAQHTRTQIENIGKFYDDFNKTEQLKTIFRKEAIDQGFFMTEENMIGHTLGLTTIPIFRTRWKDDFSIIATRLLLAIRAYEIENDKTPKSLKQIIPRGEEIPKDPFSGDPINICFEERIIYSDGRGIMFSTFSF